MVRFKAGYGLTMYRRRAGYGIVNVDNIGKTARGHAPLSLSFSTYSPGLIHFQYRKSTCQPILLLHT